MELLTARLRIRLQTRKETEAMIEAMSEYDRAQISSDWLSRLRAAAGPDPWVHSFRVLLRECDAVVGSCGFKGPPVDGVVEIAYGIDADHQGRGYATESARALVEFAAGCDGVIRVRAHTLPGAVASQRVLAKCGFEYQGEVIDPEDGPVARFERPVNGASEQNSA